MQRLLNSLSPSVTVGLLQRVGGDISYTVPYTGNFEISLSGSQGSAYSDSSGGYGYTLKKNVRLEYGDVLRYVVPRKPTGYTNATGTTTVSGGNAAQLYLNDTLVWTAGSGSGYVNNVIAETGIDVVKTLGGAGNSAGQEKTYTVHWHTGNGKSGSTHANQFPTIYTHSAPSGCYVWGGHTHDALGACSWTYTTHDHSIGGCRWVDGYPIPPATSNCTIHSYHPCEHEKPGYVDAHWEDCNGALNAGHRYTCAHENNTWVIGCGYRQGEIKSVANDAQPGTCFYANGWTPDVQSLSNTGDAKFSIKLLEQQSVFYKNVNATVSYKNVKPNLIISDNVVTYFKRP